MRAVYDIGKALKNNPTAPIVDFPSTHSLLILLTNPKSSKRFMNPTEAKPFYEPVHSIYDFRLYRCRHGYSSADGYKSPLLPARLPLPHNWQRRECLRE